MDFHLLRQLNQTRRDRQAAILITDTTNSDTRLVRERDGYGDDPLAEELAAGFRSGRSGFVAAPERGHMFLTVSVPPPRLVVIGAVHISQALAPMAKLAGFDTTIIDPRTAFATADRSLTFVPRGAVTAVITAWATESAGM
jgi:xanthine dehydrogenase accessory factor